jgi:hypothetical protein
MSQAVSVESRDLKAETIKRRKPYQKPTFRFERVFETMALACGKIAPTQKHCQFVRKSS